MANIKISALDALAGSAVDSNDDLFLIVDTTAPIQTKSITSGQLLEFLESNTRAYTGAFSVDSPTFVVDNSNNRVGIGTTSPGADLEIASATTNAPSLRFNRAGDDAITVDDQLGRLQFYGLDSESAPGAYIDIDADGAWNTTADIHTAPTRICFHTQDVSTSDTLGTPRMTIKADGKVGIGIETPTAPLHIDQSSSSGSVAVLKLDQGDVDDSFIDFIGTTGAASLKSLSTSTAVASAKFGAIRVKISAAGEDSVYKWIRVYDSAV